MKSFYAAGAIIAAGLVWSAGWAQPPSGQIGHPSFLGYGSPAPVAQPYPYPVMPTAMSPTYANQPPRVARLPQVAAYNSGGVGVASPHGMPGPGSVSTNPVGSNVAAGVVPGTACQGGSCGVAAAYGAVPWDSAGADCWSCLPPTPPAQWCPKWFGGVVGLYLTRTGDDDHYLLYDPYVDDRLYLNAADASMDWAGGVEARIGRTFHNCCWGFEGVYWGLFPNDENAWVEIWNTPSAALHTTMDLTDVWLDFYDPVNDIWWNDNIHNAFNDNVWPVQAAAVSRSFEFHNVELNFLSGPLVKSACCDSCGPNYGSCGAGACGMYGYGGPGCGRVAPRPRLQVGWLLGFRWFKFNEDFHFAMENDDGVIDYYSAPNNEFYYDIDVDNNLFGVQLGCNLDYFVTKCLHLEAGAKFGVFANYMEHCQRIYNQHGTAYIDPANAAEFCVKSHETDAAVLGELRAGVGYRLGRNCRWTGGYRVVGLGGVALTLDQIPYGSTFGALHSVNNIDSNGHLILHGAYTGLEFAF